MVFALTETERSWLKQNYPSLKYDSEYNRLIGEFRFSLQFRSLEPITDSYVVAIHFNSYENLPIVYELGGKIARTALIQGRTKPDMHIYGDNHLCLIRWDKLKEWYCNKFKIKTFMRHLESHLYWVSYVDRYGKEPWPAEKHGW